MKHVLLTLSLFLSMLAFGKCHSAFSCDATRGCSPLVVNLTDHSTGGATSWYWDLGNGNTSTHRNPSATYLNPGNYAIKLIVSDGIHTDSITQTITVFMKPSVDFRVTVQPPALMTRSHLPLR